MKSKDLKTVYLTKYALTSGIEIHMAKVDVDGDSCNIEKNGKWAFSQNFYGKEWHLTEAEARKEFIAMKNRKTKSLKNQLAKIQEMTFEKQLKE